MSDSHAHQVHAARREALRGLLAERELDAMLLTDLRNIRYLTGFTGSNGALLVHSTDDKRTVFCTDGRYEQQAQSETGDLELLIERRCAAALVRQAGTEPAHFEHTGFESQHVSVDAFDTLAQQSSGFELRRAPGVVERLRMLKDESEIEAIRMACAAADRALAELIEHGGVREGLTERQVARELEARMLDNGAVGPAFSTIVAAGAHSAIPHHRPTEAVLHSGDLVKLDFGAVIEGYHSDMTRMLVLGRPAEWQRDLYQLVYTAQSAGRKAATDTARVADVDAAARGVIERAGYGEEFPHGLGHGVGLDIHEAPWVGQERTGTLSPGATVTVEPGVYLAGRGGVRIEDTLVVREEGTEVLTLSTKELVTV